MGKMPFEVHWKMTGVIEVMAESEEDADRQVSMELSPDDIVDRSKNIAYDTRYVTKKIIK